MTLDRALFSWVNGLAGKSAILDGIMKLVGNDYFIPVSFSLVLLGLWFSDENRTQRERNQRTVLCTALSLGITNGLIKLLNLLYFRPRPFTEQEVNLLFYRPTDSSFPSNLTAVAFAFATSIWLSHRKGGTILFLPAILVAASRVYIGVHYPSDVIAGAALGILVSYGCFRLFPLLEPVPSVALQWARKLHLA